MLVVTAALLLTFVMSPDEALARDRAAAGTVIVAPLTGDVDPVMLAFADRVLDRADKRDDIAAVVFELDTPGGLASAMDDIMKRFAASKNVPVIVWVAPSGARAASAGTFITYASDIAAMAPGTNIGSATPITGSGADLPKDLRRKVLNDAVAKIREQATDHGRNADFAERAVRKADNIGAREALELGVVDELADSVPSLLKKIDGKTAQPKKLILHTADAQIERIDPPITLRILKHLVDPNLLFVLFGAGLVGLVIELANPGAIVPGAAGTISLLLALYGMQVLPVSGAGLSLLLIGLGLIVAEALVVSGGALGISGAVAVTIGGLFLYDDNSGYGISRVLLFSVGAFLVVGMFAIARVSYRIRRTRASTGEDALVGRIATVRTPLTSDGESGTVFVSGELWRARLTQPDVITDADVSFDTVDVGTSVRIDHKIAGELILDVTPVVHPVTERHPTS